VSFGWKKGDRSNLCPAPSGPFRQIGPVPFSTPSGYRGCRTRAEEGPLSRHRRGQLRVPVASGVPGPVATCAQGATSGCRWPGPRRSRENGPRGIRVRQPTKLHPPQLSVRRRWLGHAQRRASGVAEHGSTSREAQKRVLTPFAFLVFRNWDNEIGCAPFRTLRQLHPADNPWPRRRVDLECRTLRVTERRREKPTISRDPNAASVHPMVRPSVSFVLGL